MASSTKILVLVTGAGRSGTSTIAGVFARLGFLVPQPVLQANESNPRGFYESRWPVRFHLRLVKRAGVEQTDGQPSAGSLISGAVDEKARQSLHDWLGEQFRASDRVMVKDPRAAWVPALWSDAARALGVEIAYVTMLRHPSEVLGSRSTYYAQNRPSMSPRQFAIWNLCGWINQNLNLEHGNRNEKRAFIRYADLLADWRPVLARMLGDLGLPQSIMSTDAEAEIDDFIEPRLRRHEVDWGDHPVPPALVEIAEQTWSALGDLADGGGQASGTAELDAISDRYRTLYTDAAAIAQDYASYRARRALKQGRRDGRRQAAEELAAKRLPVRVRRSVRRLMQRIRRT
jgi:hypothetical protein